MSKFIIFLATAYVVFSVLRLFGVFEFMARPAKTTEEVQSKRKLTKQRRRESFYLSLCTDSVEYLRGIFMSDLCYENHVYYIQRLDIRTKYLGRTKTPEEVRGEKVLPFVLSLLVIPLGVFMPPLFLIPAVTFANLISYQTRFRMTIADEDTIIENYFIDLYLLLYSKLKQGSRARLQGTVENYISTLEASRSSEESRVMLKFARYFLNLLALYEDHVAVPHLRDNYHSATVINFCNVATQALNGVENFDNLLTFKMQLTERKTKLMRERQQAILRKGERSILAIWIILFIFIIVGWYSKLPTGALF